MDGVFRAEQATKSRRVGADEARGTWSRDIVIQKRLKGIGQPFFSPGVQ